MALFCEAQGENVDFSGARLRQSLFTGAVLPGSDFTGADLWQTHFAGADLTRARMPRAELSYADLSHARLPEVDLRDATLFRTCLHGAHTDNAQMSDRARALETDPERAQAEQWRAPVL